MNRYRYIVREVFKDKSFDIPPRENLFTSLEEADRYAFRRAEVLNDSWQVYVCRYRLMWCSMISQSKN